MYGGPESVSPPGTIPRTRPYRPNRLTETNPSQNLFDYFADQCRQHPDRPLLVTDTGATYTYADLDDVTARYAGVFARHRLEPGDRLAAQVDKSPEALFLYLACLRFGLIYLPLNTAYREKELEYFFSDAEPAMVVGGPDARVIYNALLPRGTPIHTLDRSGHGSFTQAATNAVPIETIQHRQSDDTAAIVYTSGTTGRPKGAMVSHGNLTSNAGTLVEAWCFSGDDILLHVLPLFHVHGLFVACHCIMWHGGTMRFLRDSATDNLLRFLPEATVMMGVPTHYTRLLDSPDFSRGHCRSIRLFISGSAPLPPRVFEAFEQRTGHGIVERYGMTETGMNTSNPLDGPRLPGTVGPPLPGVEVRIVDDDGNPKSRGEIGMLQVRGPNVFRGYWRKPDKTAEEFTEDGYFITGDLASMDADGYIRIEGRGKDLIISGGYNIYPKEIELCIDTLAGVRESAVVGLPHHDYGESVCAVVVCEDGSSLTESSVIDHVKRELASFKAPKSVHFAEALPRNAMGKVQKNVLREQLAADNQRK